MWGNIATESTFQTNFNVGFSNTKADILIHLSQWQYWWWFWFSFIWTLYFLLIIRAVRFRTLKFAPKIATTFRPHGKWGDLLVCMIPLSWCANILINSSFLLKLIEWQSESSLFTIRIRGKQWYWVYKYDLKDVTDVLSAAKNVGNGKWFVPAVGALEVADDYLHFVQLRAANTWIHKYWNVSLKAQGVEEQEHVVSNFSREPILVQDLKNVLVGHKSEAQYRFFGENLEFSLRKKMRIINTNSFKVPFNYKFLQNKENFKNFNVPVQNTVASTERRNFSNYDESFRWAKRSFGTTAPSYLVKIPLTDDTGSQLFSIRFGAEKTTIVPKNITYAPYLVLKQKRYTLKKKILPKIFLTHTKLDAQKKKIPSTFFLKKTNKVAENSVENLTRTYRMFKKNKKRTELFSVANSRRLLRTRRTLVLPVHVNITAITNSYDVVHSWFIPGLGLKLDCIPGRATHHTFYVDNVGFYYGQCAEICGRYHHHMPIRVCVLPYEQFLIWWFHFGLPRLMYSGKQRATNNQLYFRKYVW